MPLPRNLLFVFIDFGYLPSTFLPMVEKRLKMNTLNLPNSKELTVNNALAIANDYSIKEEFLRAAFLVLGNGYDGPGLLDMQKLRYQSSSIPYGYLFILAGDEIDIGKRQDQEDAFKFFAETIRATTSGVSSDEKGWEVAQKLVTGICAAYDLDLVNPKELPKPFQPPAKIMLLRSASRSP